MMRDKIVPTKYLILQLHKYKTMQSLFRNRWNIVTAMTNAEAIYPLYVCYKAGDPSMAYLVAVAATASLVSHLFENHKHGMEGFGFSRRISIATNVVDILASLILIGTVGKMAWNLYLKGDSLFLAKIFACYGVCNVFLLLNESDYSASTQRRYLVCHNIWHIGVFTTLRVFPERYYLK